MARIDKAWIMVRAIAGTALTGVLGVKLNAGGSVVPAGTADAIGVVCYPGTIAAGRPCAFMTRGEIVEFGGTAGTPYYAAPAGGTMTTTATNGTRVGTTIEADRLVVNM